MSDPSFKYFRTRPFRDLKVKASTLNWACKQNCSQDDTEYFAWFLHEHTIACEKSFAEY